MEITIMDSEERYNNRQIERMLEKQSEDLKEHINLVINPLTNQVTLTNGTVKWQTKMLYTALGALMLLVPWAGWVTTSILDKKGDSITQEDLDRAIDQSLLRYEKNE